MAFALSKQQQRGRKSLTGRSHQLVSQGPGAWTASSRGPPSSHGGLPLVSSGPGVVPPWRSGGSHPVPIAATASWDTPPAPAPPREEDCEALLEGLRGPPTICALIESRAREVGLAALNQRSMEIELTQFGDSGTFRQTASALLALEPGVVVVSRSCRGTQILNVVEEALAHAGLPPPTYLERRFFNETEGQSLMEQADVTGLQPVDFAAKFVACAALAALWRYTESTYNLRLQARAARIRFRSMFDAMVIDSSTARMLELVSDMKGDSVKTSVAGLFNCRTLCRS